MTDLRAADVDAQVKRYLLVFGTLLTLTLITVGVAALDLGGHSAIALALFIASIKASLVAAFFMHLVSEKKLIYSILLVTLAFLVALLLLPALTSSSEQTPSTRVTERSGSTTRGSERP